MLGSRPQTLVREAWPPAPHDVVGISRAMQLDDGDVAGPNYPFGVFGELVQKRLGAGSLTSVFPGRSYSPPGLFTAS